MLRPILVNNSTRSLEGEKKGEEKRERERERERRWFYMKNAFALRACIRDLMRVN